MVHWRAGANGKEWRRRHTAFARGWKKRALVSDQNCFLGFPIHKECNVCAERRKIRIIGRERATCSVLRESVVGHLKMNSEIAPLVCWENLNPQDKVVARLHVIAPLCHNRMICRDWEST